MQAMPHAPEFARSLPVLLRDACHKWTGRPAMMHRPESAWETITYSDLYAIAHRYASAIQSYGLKRGDRLCILSENCPEWAFVDWGCQTLGVIVVPIFPTLPKDQVQYIVKDSGALLVVCGDKAQFDKTVGITGVRGVPLKDVQGDSIEFRANEPSLLMPKDEWEREIEMARHEDVATIIYTSGTTGEPKGAMIPHRAYTFLCRAALSNLPLDENDLFLSFLPMSHVYERFAGQVLPFSCGACVAFAKSLASLAADIQAVKPTVMLCVPRFLEATREKISDGARKQGGLKEKLFNLALSQGARRAKGGFAPLSPLLDKVVGAKIRDRLGGRIRFLVSGGAALAPHVAEFYEAFGINILQGYGLTETCAASCVNHPDRSKYWTVGEPLAGVQVEIAPDGEILIGGLSVMTGYWNKPEATREAIDEHGWFHTGDIGEWEGAHLKITDRKKDLLVLGNGKNVAPQPIENKLKASPFIAEAVVLGDGMEHCVALIVPSLEAFKREFEAKGYLAPKSEAELVDHPDARTMIKREVDAINKTLAGYEMVKKFALIGQPFSVESGELTPSFKVKRKVVKQKYADVVAGLR